MRLLRAFFGLNFPPNLHFQTRHAHASLHRLHGSHEQSPPVNPQNGGRISSQYFSVRYGSYQGKNFAGSFAPPSIDI